MSLPPPTELTSLQGQIEVLSDGQLALQIPLVVGGDKLAPFAKGIGRVDGEFLVVVIPPWLAEKLRIGAGSIVSVNNANGKFTITRSAENDRI